MKNLFCMAVFSSIGAVSVTQQTHYPAFCWDAAHNDQVFITFRSHLMCRTIVENLSFQEGEIFLKVIKDEYPFLITFFPKICTDDVLGTPRSFNFSIGTCSPIVMRYLKIAGDLLKHFPNLANFNIVEIGGGFGGQCKILSDITQFRSYTIIDLPECTSLIRKYLNRCNVGCYNTVDSDKVFHISSDLLISNYAISEINRVEQLEYIEKIINRAEHGYIIYNLMPHVEPLLLSDFLEKISIPKREIVVQREYPATGNDNYLILWWPQNSP